MILLLLDTHALIWLLDGSPRLSAVAGQAIEQAETVYASAASAWEITTKHRLGKLDWRHGAAEKIEAVVRRHGAMPLPISFQHASLCGQLEIDHADPFDRMLIAQALSDDLVLVSNEKRFDAFGVRRLW